MCVCTLEHASNRMRVAVWFLTPESVIITICPSSSTNLSSMPSVCQRAQHTAFPLHRSTSMLCSHAGYHYTGAQSTVTPCAFCLLDSVADAQMHAGLCMLGKSAGSTMGASLAAGMCHMTAACMMLARHPSRLLASLPSNDKAFSPLQLAPKASCVWRGMCQ